MRFIARLWTLGTHSLVRIQTTKGTDLYVLVEVSKTLYRVVKADGTSYTINLLDDTCDCPAGQHHGHCKHREGVKALLSHERLRKAQEAPKAHRVERKGRVFEAFPYPNPETPYRLLGGRGAWYFLKRQKDGSLKSERGWRFVEDGGRLVCA